MHDGHGRMVPRRLEPIFDGAKRLAEIASALSSLQSDLSGRRHEPYMRDVDVSRVLKHIQAAASLLSLGKPALSRCVCHPGEVDCAFCGGQKWISEVARLTGRNGEQTSK